MVSCSAMPDLSANLGERFSAFVAMHNAEFVGRAKRVLNDLHAAEDVVQETLARVWKHADRLPDDQWLPYARRAVQLNAIKRRMRRRPAASLHELEHDPAGEDRPDSLSEFTPADLEQALGELPQLQQTAVRARFYLGLSFAQAADALQVSQNTVASRCRYAIAALRKRLGGH